MCETIISRKGGPFQGLLEVVQNLACTKPEDSDRASPQVSRGHPQYRPWPPGLAASGVLN